MERYRIAIVGSGPAGLSAAGRAAELGISHILLEAEEHISNTVNRYQKGKFVMAEPTILPLRSNLDFDAGSREQVLSAWSDGVKRLGINIRFGAEVRQLDGSKGSFSLRLGSGETIEAEQVVLAIGFQGNLNRLEIPGAESPAVQYQLDDPDEYHNEAIAVIGASDSAIENALALSANNSVVLVSRSGNFNRAKEANQKSVQKAIDKRKLGYRVGAPVKIEPLDPATNTGQIAKLCLNTQDGEHSENCDRIIARLGATAPRKFLESMGIRFPNSDKNAVPVISQHYESNVEGIYLVGALAGCPLIKQAMNQGHEVIDHIEGRLIDPADEDLLRSKLDQVRWPFPRCQKVQDTLEHLAEIIPLLQEMSAQQLRELILYSTVRALEAKDILFNKEDYIDSFFMVVSGRMLIESDQLGTRFRVRMGAGRFFGESGMITGCRWTASATALDSAIVIEVPRQTMYRVLKSVAPIDSIVSRAFVKGIFERLFSGEVKEEEFEELYSNAVAPATIADYQSGQELFREGDHAGHFYLVRSGSITVSRTLGEIAPREVVLSYVAAANYIPDTSILADLNPRHSVTARAAIRTEIVKIDLAALKRLLMRYPAVKSRFQQDLYRQFGGIVQSEGRGFGGNTIIDFIGKHGLGEATNVLLIDESLCVSCDNCEKACAGTHDGISRLDRESGASFANIHVPTSCRHCEHPHCMAACSPDAIYRKPNGEIHIDANRCIVCGNCIEGCPYGVITPGVEKEPLPTRNLLSRLLFGEGRNPSKSPDAKTYGQQEPEPATYATQGKKKVPVKCDMCSELPGGPACVRACPTGATMRVTPVQFMEIVQKVRAKAGAG